MWNCKYCWGRFWKMKFVIVFKSFSNHINIFFKLLITERSVNFLNYKCGFVYVFLLFCLFFLHLFWNFAVGCIYILDCYVFLINGSTYVINTTKYYIFALSSQVFKEAEKWESHWYLLICFLAFFPSYPLFCLLVMT